MINTRSTPLFVRIAVVFLCCLCLVTSTLPSTTAYADIKYSLSNGSKLSTKLDKSSATLMVGKKLTLNATLNKSKTYVSSVKWTSSNSTIATVNSNGIVTGKKGGTVTISCTAKDRAGITSKASCKITVYDGSIRLSESNISLNATAKDTKQLKCTLNYLNTATSNITWTSSNKKVATVNSNGKVTAIAAGKATITAVNKQTGHSAKCTVSVYQEKILSVKSREQTNSSTCSGAAARAVLNHLGSSFRGTDVDLYNAMKEKHPNKSNTVGDIVQQLNKYLKSKPYSYVSTSNKTTWTNALIKSIDQGYPVIALVKFSKNDYFKYKTSGHFTVIRGYKKTADGTVTLYITDSYKTSQNNGTFSIPLNTFFPYSKNKGGYLILKK